MHSFEHGTEKPDPLLFAHACVELGVTEEEALMVGDNPVKDGGAVAAGPRSSVLPTGAAPGAHRGLDAVPHLAGAVGGPRSSDTAASRRREPRSACERAELRVRSPVATA
nr:HAD hydrolase-like protein [Streptomyces sulphureus]